MGLLGDHLKDLKRAAFLEKQILQVTVQVKLAPWSCQM